MQAQIRQGDILLDPTDETPPKRFEPKARKNGKLIVAEGEATGHHHVIDDDSALMLVDPKAADDVDGSFIEVTHPVDLAHDEHETLTVPAGRYKVVRQREYQETFPAAPPAAPRFIYD